MIELLRPYSTQDKKMIHIASTRISFLGLVSIHEIWSGLPEFNFSLPPLLLSKIASEFVGATSFFRGNRNDTVVPFTLPCSFLLKWLVPWWSDPLFYGGIKAVIVGCARAK